MAQILALGIGSAAVDGQEIALVFDGPRVGQGIPGQLARYGPVGAAYYGVIVAAVSVPYGETKVVADGEQEADSPPGDHLATVSPGEGAVLSAEIEEVTLVVMLFPFGGYEIESVEEDPSLAAGHASGNRTIVLLGELAHPGKSHRGIFLHYLARSSGKAGGEHFGENYEIRFGSVGKKLFQFLDIGFRRAPDNILLNE